MSEEINSALRSVNVLSSLSDDLIQQIASFSKLRTVRKGETIFCQGEPSPYCFGVVRGQVSIQRVAKDRAAPPKLLSILNQGVLFGESALFEESPRVAMASASEDGQLVAILGSRWREWIRSDAAASVPLLMGLLQSAMGRLQQTSTELAVIDGVGRILAQNNALEARLSAASSFIQSSLQGMDHVVVYRPTFGTGNYQPIACAPFMRDMPALRRESVLVTKALTGGSMVLTDVAELPWATPSLFVLPLADLCAAAFELHGLMVFSSPHPPTIFTTNLQILLTALSRPFAEALSRQHAQEPRASGSARQEVS